MYSHKSKQGKFWRVHDNKRRIKLCGIRMINTCGMKMRKLLGEKV